MTDEQKAAKELFDKYWMYLRAGLIYDEEAKEDARHCALIAIDEALGYADFTDEDTIEFLQEVKKEIEKI